MQEKNIIRTQKNFIFFKKISLLVWPLFFLLSFPSFEVLLDEREIKEVEELHTFNPEIKEVEELQHLNPEIYCDNLRDNSKAVH